MGKEYETTDGHGEFIVREEGGQFRNQKRSVHGGAGNTSHIESQWICALKVRTGSRIRIRSIGCYRHYAGKQLSDQET